MRASGIGVFLAAIISSSAPARTWHLQPDGSGDALTIAAAIDSVTAGDVIELACGTYYEWALMLKSGLTIRSATGQPECAIIDGLYPASFGGIFQCWSVDASTMLEGLTITGGQSRDGTTGIHGGGVVIGDSSLWLVRCRITGNRAKTGGGVVIYPNSYPTFVECEITGNWSQFDAGGVLVYPEATFEAFDSVITGNVADSGPADGAVIEGGVALFHCCELDLQEWRFDGAYLVDTRGCGIVGVEGVSWGGLKSLFR